MYHYTIPLLNESVIPLKRELVNTFFIFDKLLFSAAHHEDFCLCQNLSFDGIAVKDPKNFCYAFSSPLTYLL